MHRAITIDAVAPTTVHQAEPIRVTFSVDLPANSDARVVTVTLLTDDARLQLVEHGSEESPPEKLLPAQPGTRLTRTMTVSIHRRKGLVDDSAAKNAPSPLCIVARLKTDRDDLAGFGTSPEILVADLGRKQEPKIFA